MTPHFRLATSTLTLRTLTLDDAEKLYQMSQEEALKKWIPTQVYRDLAQTKDVLAYLASQYQDAVDPRTCPLVFGVVHTPSGTLIGHVGLSPFRGCVEIGFAIEDSQNRKGYATAAVQEMCKWAVKEYKLNKIHGFVAKENEASKCVLTRAGFTFVEERNYAVPGSG